MGCQAEAEETLCDALFHCHANDGVGLQVLGSMQNIQHGLGAEAALRLEVQAVEDDELPVVWVLATTLRLLWNARQSSSRVRNYVIRSQLEAEINLLRETRYSDSVPKIEDLSSSILQIR